MTMNSALRTLKSIGREMEILEGTEALLHWDKSTFLPKKAAEQRSEQVAYISGLLHAKRTDPQFQKAVQQLRRRPKGLSFVEKRLVEEYTKKMNKWTKIPLSHVEEFSKVAALSFKAWERAREKNDFTMFAPYLEKIVQLKKKEAVYINPKGHPYEVLMDEFEEGMTIVKVEAVFAKLKPELMGILSKIKNSKRYKAQQPRTGNFPVETQKLITQDISRMILGENDCFCCVESVHPFTTTICPDDVRITTAYQEDPLFSFLSTAHECGHALYELGFGDQLRGTVLFDSPSFGLHESQSRFWENQVMKSREFWQYYYPFYRKHFPALSAVSADDFYFSLNQVRPSLIRIECDEVTYCLHIIIRYELERALLEGKIAVKELPQLWAAKYQVYLGVEPKNAVEGVLQDVHWSEGSFGYFPSYAIGTMYAATIFSKVQKHMPGVRGGDFGPIIQWLRKNIHQHGALYPAEEVVRKSCGKGLTADDFLAYLKKKYYGLYGV
ncbi:carboxypeptidase M32 [Candidatus Woesearchaeota archaeon]|nr:carboxypeptidase M32 [Candidatus Woesearchaeota archaeon]